MRKLCRMFLFFSLLMPITLFSQPFSFESDTLTYSNTPGHFFAIDAPIVNNSPDSLHLRIKRVLNDLPSENWASSMCNGIVCYAPFIDEFTVPDTSFLAIPPLAPGDSVDFILDVISGLNDPGTASVTIRVELWDDPAVARELTFVTTTVSTGLDDRDALSANDFQLHANYPNPFNPVTKIPFSIGGNKTVDVQLTIYNLLGQHIATLLNDRLAPGNYEVNWNARDNRGGEMPSGVYLYELKSDDFQLHRKMILLR